MYLSPVGRLQRQEELRAGFLDVLGEQEHGLRIRHRAKLLLPLDGLHVPLVRLGHALYTSACHTLPEYSNEESIGPLEQQVVASYLQLIALGQVDSLPFLVWRQAHLCSK
jgi:hypothetical protein